MNRKPVAAPRHQQGLSLIESLIALAITVVSIGTALPGLGELRERRHLDGTAAQLETDLQFARSLAVARNQTVRFSVMRAAGGSCYVIHSGAASDCRCTPTGETTCRAGAQSFRAVGFAAGHAVALNSNAASMVFDPNKGTVTPTSTMRIEGRERSLHVVINIMGRVRSCAAGGQFPGYPAC